MFQYQILKAWMTSRVELLILNDDRGEVTEKVIVVALFAGLAIAAGAVIVAKVMARAEGLSLN